jgi:hypothetical protein
MKKSLGRGLSQLMRENAPEETVSKLSRAASAPEGGPSERRTGVSRLMQGRDETRPSKPEPIHHENPFQSSESCQTEFSVRRVPDWIFYLGDLVLLSAVVWMVILNPAAPTRVEWTTSLLLTIVAALVGIYPWARNILGNDSINQGDEVPQWSLAHKLLPDGTEKVYVIHLHEPFTAVEITETTWNGVQPKPIWLSGAPDISPEHMKRLLLGAAEYYKQQCSKTDSCNSTVSAA